MSSSSMRNMAGAAASTSGRGLAAASFVCARRSGVRSAAMAAKKAAPAVDYSLSVDPYDMPFPR